MRILIADDQPDMLEALRLVLKNEGFQTEAASSPTGVLRAVESRDVDCVLMDLNYTRDTTSGREGLDLLERLRDLDGTLPVVVMTAWGSVDLAVEAMRRGARDFVLKPWENGRLVRTLREHTGERSRLARERADRAESDRSAARELEFARQVQGNLFPQRLPELDRLDVAGACLEAGAVGGDYYDVIDLGPGRAALALADASGKGISAALLMANLQATLRSRVETMNDDARGLMRAVNRLFYSSTAPERYATLFFARWDDRARSLAWVNCGHNAPILLRRDGSVERLAATATVLGLIETWDCEEARSAIDAGDRLVVFSDGVTEARDEQGEEFGEGRLIDALRGATGLTANDQVDAVLAAVRAWTGGEQEDDLTLVVLQGR